MATPAQFMVLAGGAFSPLDTGVVRSWFDSSQMVADGNAAADGNQVATWTDHGSNARNLTQATGIKQPLFRTNIQNGRPVVRFDGSDDFLQSANFAADIATPWCAFLSMAYRGTPGIATNRNFLGGDSAAAKRAEIYKKATTDFWTFFQSDVGTERISSTAANASWHIVMGRWDATASGGLFVDGGAALVSGAMTNTVQMRGLTLGSYVDGLQNGQIDVAEVILAASPSVAQQNQLGSYLAARYGTSWASVT